MRRRWYDPETQRFISRDPIGLAGGTNSYSYGSNNPVTMTDHTGLEPDLTDSSTRRQIYGDALSQTFSWDTFSKWAWSQLEALDLVTQFTRPGVSNAVGYTVGQLDLGISSSGDNSSYTMLMIAAAFRSKAALQQAKKSARSAGRCVPENDLFGAGLHGLKWSNADALKRARETGRPQGRFTREALDFADAQAQSLKFRDADSFALPPGVKADVFYPDGTVRDATHIFVWHNVEGQWHGYPRVGRGKVFGR